MTITEYIDYRTMNHIQLFSDVHPNGLSGHSVAPFTSPLDPPAALWAQQTPRDEARAWGQVLRACRQPDLAETALAQSPEGGAHLTLALAEALARQWGNLESGVIDLGAVAGGSLVMVYAWDLETNTRRARRFQIPGADAAPLSAKTGRLRSGLTPPTTLPNRLHPALTAALRECLLGVLPRPLAAAAVAECDRTQRSAAMGPATPRARRLAAGFAELGLAPAPLTPAPGETDFPASAAELTRLSRILNALREGLAQPADFFLATTPAEPPPAGPTDLHFRPTNPENGVNQEAISPEIPSITTHNETTPKPEAA